MGQEPPQHRDPGDDDHPPQFAPEEGREQAEGDHDHGPDRLGHPADPPERVDERVRRKSTVPTPISNKAIQLI
ncbi:hypothetical protein NBCG_01783 [Nocardioidaceae bacterium Broad-1]|nr:hypothetical protein NBCG_01783 [Nocardioidaceae bacterium Broad-1]